MKKEIELKFFVDNLDPVRRNLKKMKARFEGSFRESDYFFDTPQNTVKKRKAVLRLRIGDSRHFLTYKENIEKGRFKVSDEYETSFENPKVLLKIFERLGFRVWFHYAKSPREYWRCRNSLITLDSFPFGKFIEIEGGPRRIKFIARKLNLDFSRTSTKSYTQLLKEHRKK